MTAESPIVAFLNARYDEDEQAARRAGTHCWHECDDGDLEFHDRFAWERVLREVEAKRRILDDMVPVLDDLNEIAYGEGQAARRPGRPGEYMDQEREPTLHLLRLLALPHEGHPDYAAAAGTVTP